MSKYSYEFKNKVVMDYINAKGGYKSLFKENGRPSQTILRDWITAYKEFGNKGLMPVSYTHLDVYKRQP